MPAICACGHVHPYIVPPQQYADIRCFKAGDADADARPEFLADDLAVNLGAGEKRQHDGTEAGKKVHPRRDVEPYGIASNRADHDLDKRHRHGDADRDDRG
jgi:hypothetical protein